MSTHVLPDPELNPYGPPAADESQVASHGRLARLLLALIGLVLLIRALFSMYGFVQIYILQPIPDSSFYDALMVKDAIYALSALGGASLIVFPSRAGWFCSSTHWIWCVTADFIVAFIATKFPHLLFGTVPGAARLTLACALGVSALAVLHWRPVMERCGVTIPRMRRFAAMFVGELALAFLLSWLALSRLW